MNPASISVFAVIYARVSTDAQALTPSLDVQEQQARACAESLSATVAAVHRDEGLSGALYHARPGLQEALATIESLRRAHPTARLLLLCSRLDRAGRDVAGLVQIRRRLRALGAELHFADGLSTPDTATGNLVGNTLGAIAEFERAMIRERTMSGRKASAAAGRQPGRSLRPMGYRIVRACDVYPGSEFAHADIGRYFVIENEAATVRRLFEGYALGEFSLHSAARWLHVSGIPTMAGGAWRATAVRYMLSNPVYVGRARYGFRSWWREETDAGRVVTRHRYLPGDACTYIPCPAIVDEATFAAVQNRMATNRRDRSGNPAQRHLLTGIARCVLCGRNLQHRKTPSGDYYTCRDSTPSRRADGIVCNPRHYRARDLERYALAAVREALARPDAIAAAIEQARSEMGQAAGQGGDAGRLAAMERQERAAMQAEVAAIADGRDPEPYRRLLRELASKRAGMGQGAGAQVAPALARLASLSVPSLCALLARAMERIESEETTDETRSRVLSSVVRSVTPDEKGDAMLTELQPLTAGATVERITIRSTVDGRLERVFIVWDEPGEGGKR